MLKRSVKLKPKSDEQWADCPRRERAKVSNVNLDIKDLVNPWELAKQFSVPLSRLRAISGGKDSKNELAAKRFCGGYKKGNPEGSSRSQTKLGAIYLRTSRTTRAGGTLCRPAQQCARLARVAGIGGVLLQSCPD